ncbi:MAG: hypothetical protein OEM81_07475 [Acidimicrobiia bacterium]|nr:hypothetical protein [Acidimicrobiia bacterium]MDH3397654.1 hypothetical protein [Acidimicrobiia bacterium]
MGQQPNIELDASDLPRSVLEPGVARRDGGGRPGEITEPGGASLGGAFGRPGPDSGWVLRIVRATEFDRSGAGIEAVVASVAAARAAHHGRGPTSSDVEVALILLGLRPEGIPEDVVAQLSLARVKWLSKAAHERVKGRSFLSQLSPGLLSADPERVRRLLNVAGLTSVT